MINLGQHNVCNECLNQLQFKKLKSSSRDLLLFSNEHKSFIECPMCKDKTFVNTIKEIRKNLILTELISENKNKPKELISVSQPSLIKENQNECEVAQAQAVCASVKEM
jgi:hypothetical protein